MGPLLRNSPSMPSSVARSVIVYHGSSPKEEDLIQQGRKVFITEELQSVIVLTGQELKTIEWHPEDLTMSGSQARSCSEELARATGIASQGLCAVEANLARKKGQLSCIVSKID